MGVPTMTTRTMTALEHKLLAALWRHVMKPGPRDYLCLECRAHGPVKHLVQHAPGCALFGLDPALLAQMDAFDAMPEAV